MKTPEQITEEVAEQLVTENELSRASGESARDSLAWELVNGETLIVEHALEDLVNRAIEADRTQRDPFTGSAPLIPEGNSQLGRNRIHHQNGI